MIKVYLGNITGGSVSTIPLSSGLLRCYAEQNDIIKNNVEWDNFLYHTMDGVDELVKQIKDPDVLALSCYVWNINRSIKIAKRVKKKYPNCLIVFGGPEIVEDISTLENVESYFYKFSIADLLVTFEGELPFEKILLNVISNERNWADIPNVYFKHEGQFIYKAKDEDYYLKTPIRNTSPWLNGYFDFIVKEMAEANRQIVAVVETNRGCPNKCTFCVSGSDTRIMQTVNLDLVEKEIEYVGKVSNEIIMTDTNFGLLKQDETIAKKLAEVSRKYKVLSKIFVSWAKGYNERIQNISKILADAGLVTAGVTVSLQTTTPEVLRNVKRKNLNKEEYIQAVNDFKNMGILTHTEMIIGLPGETKQSFLQSVEDILDVGPTNLLCYMLTLNANSAIFSKDSRKKHEIKTKQMNIYHVGEEEDEYEYIESILSNKYMTKEELQWLFKWKDFFAFTYVGLWIYYIAQYCKQEYKMTRVELISILLDYGISHPNSVVGKCVSNWYVKNYNSGNFVSYVGPKSPHNVDWKSNFFLKQTFHWLCISENREQFYKEVEEVLLGNGVWGDKTKDALLFQQQMMIDFNYDPKVGVKYLYNYNWFEYFHLGYKLKYMKNYVLYTTQHAGRNKTQIKPNDSESMFIVAGGDLYKQQTQNTFIHRYTDMYEATTSNLIKRKDTIK